MAQIQRSCIVLNYIRQSIYKLVAPNVDIIPQPLAQWKIWVSDQKQSIDVFHASRLYRRQKASRNVKQIGSVSVACKWFILRPLLLMAIRRCDVCLQIPFLYLFAANFYPFKLCILFVLDEFVLHDLNIPEFFIPQRLNGKETLIIWLVIILVLLTVVQAPGPVGSTTNVRNWLNANWRSMAAGI